MKHLARSYGMLTEDTTRIMGRLKAVYRGQAIAAPARSPMESGIEKSIWHSWHERGLAPARGCLYQELDALQPLRRQAKRELIWRAAASTRGKGLRSIPFLGPIRIAKLIGRVQTPHRFRGKRQFWAYCGLAWKPAAVPSISLVHGQMERKKSRRSFAG